VISPANRASSPAGCDYCGNFSVAIVTCQAFGRVDAAANFGDLLFKLNILARDTEAVDQQLADIGSHGFMGRTLRKLQDDLG